MVATNNDVFDIPFVRQERLSSNESLFTMMHNIPPARGSVVCRERAKQVGQ